MDLSSFAEGDEIRAETEGMVGFQRLIAPVSGRPPISDGFWPMARKDTEISAEPVREGER